MDSNYSRPVNLGNPQEYTINELAQIIKQLAGKWGSLHTYLGCCNVGCQCH